MPSRQDARIAAAIAAVRERIRGRELAYTIDPGMTLAREIVAREAATPMTPSAIGETLDFFSDLATRSRPRQGEP